MNGYELTKVFRMVFDANEAMQIGCTANHHSLYTWICELRNQLQGRSPNREVMDLPVHYTMDQAYIGSDKTLKKCIDDLADWGIIEIVQRLPGNVTKIKLAIAYLRLLYDASTIALRLDDDCDTIAVRTTKTPKTDKTVKTPKTRKTGTEDLVFPSFAGEQFKATWTTLAQQPKWRGKSPDALQLRLNDLSKYDEPFAVQLMQDAIKGDWAGVVFNKKDKDGKKLTTYEIWAELQRKGPAYQHNQRTAPVDEAANVWGGGLATPEQIEQRRKANEEREARRQRKIAGIDEDPPF